MDILGIFGFVGTILTLADFGVRTGHHVEKIKLEFRQQESEYDVIRYIMQEAVNTVVSDGAPTIAIQASMLLCAKLDAELECEFQRVERILIKRGRRRPLELVRIFSRRNERRFAYEAFRDAVLLLRDLSYSMQTNRQLSAVRSDLSDIQEDSTNDDGKRVQDWDPIEYQRSTGVNLDDLTKSKLKPLTGRPLLKTLAGSNYTFDATITWVRDSNIRYTPIRGLWDTGSDAFIISREIIERAGIKNEELEQLDEIPTIHGIGGAKYKPTLRVKLTWHVNRNMNSRQDTFYVIDEANFDVLVPWTLSIGARSTGEGNEGQNALILRLRRKGKDEIQEEKEEEEKTLATTSASKQAQQEKKRRERQKTIEEREKQATVNGGAAAP